MKKIGHLIDWYRLQHEFYMDEYGKFYVSENDEMLTDNKGMLEYFAFFVNSPWSYTSELYTIKYNCKDAYTEKPVSDPDWKCTYMVIAYDGITSEIFGYGNTQQEALQDCMEMFNLLQKEFNKDNDSI